MSAFPRELRRLTQRVAFKLTAPLLSATVLIAAVIWVIFTFFFEAAFEKNAVAMQNRTTAVLQNSVSVYMREIANVLYNMAVDAELRDNLGRLSGGQTGEYPMLYSDMYSILRGYSYFHSDLVAASVAARNGDTFRYAKSLITLDDRFLFRDSAAVDEMIRIGEKARENPGILLSLEDSDPRAELVHAALAVRDYYSGEYWGAILISIHVDALGKLIDPFGEGSGEAYHFLVFDDGSLVAHPDYPDNGVSLSPETMRLLDPDYSGEGGGFKFPPGALAEWVRIPKTSSYLVSVVDRDRLLAPVRVARQSGIVLTGMILLVFVAQQLWFVRRHVASIGRLTAAIDTVQRSGDLSVSFRVESEDEMGRLAAAFSAMTFALAQADREKERQTRLLFDSEIKALESQIDSHFISNTLNAISYSAIDKGDYHTSRLLKALASTLRHTLDRTGKPVCVRDEVGWLSQYLLLQKERLGKVLEYEISAPDDVMELPVHKLLIQPFVENSIVHGLMGRTSGRLRVCFRRWKGSRLWISIHDDGRGMTARQAEEIRAVFSGEKNLTARVGVENVTARIRSYYGSGARLFLRSRVGVGTKIDIILPDSSPMEKSADSEQK